MEVKWSVRLSLEVEAQSFRYIYGHNWIVCRGLEFWGPTMSATVGNSRITNRREASYIVLLDYQEDTVRYCSK